MPNNKKHHFVPKFYMKFFSPNGKSVNLLHMKREIKLLGIPLKNQCYRDYFYGEDGKLEDALGKIESEAAEAIRRLIANERVPLHTSTDFSTILVFLLVQAFRTAYQVDMINEMTDQFIKYLVKPQFEQKFPDGDMSGISITLNDASNIAVQTAVSSFTLLADMGWLLVAANESDEFITGDTPVIFANPFLKQVNGLSNTGLTTKGLLVILPLSPRLALILFDKAVYRLHGKQTQPTFTFATSKDIEQLNILQAASCYENFYFFSADFDANGIFTRAKRYRRSAKSIQQIFPNVENERQHREILLNSQVSVDFPLSLSFLKIKNNEERWLKAFLKQKIKPTLIERNPELSKIHREYRKLQRTGIQLPDILEFLKHTCRG